MSVSALYRDRVRAGTLTEDPAQAGVLPLLDRLAEALARPPRRGLFRRAGEPVRGLYLWGGVGRGKSLLMDLLVQAVPVAKERRHFHEFLQWVQARLAAARAKGVEDALRPVAEELAGRVRLLAFDEMQVSDIADAMILGRLFTLLLDGGVTVVTTSNRPPEDLYKDGLNRHLFLPFIALLRDRLDVVELSGPTDHRQGRLATVPRYFTPIGPAARAAVAALWEGFGGADAHPLTLKVHGRSVVIPAFVNGVARATFYDLCNQPLGPADYLALAEAARLLILEDIPQMGADNFNQARRFVTLIDALYEARSGLICTAAARPGSLYIEGEGSFEFARTESRLTEMTSDGWGRA